MSATLLIEKYEAFVSTRRKTSKFPLLEIDADLFNERFNRGPFTISHNLANHPLFELRRLVELARTISDDDSSVTPRTGISVEETIRRIEEGNSSVVLKHVEKHPAYRALLNQCLDEIADYSENLAPGMSRREAFILISSPHAVTPYHMNPEHSFLLQIRGSKTITAFDREDRTIVSEEELERYLSGKQRNLVYRDELESRGERFQLTPGLGLHIPVTAPHYVRNETNVSISFCVTFRNPAIDRRTMVYTVNSFLRKKGFPPTPFGRSRLRDDLKCQAYRTFCRLKA